MNREVRKQLKKLANTLNCNKILFAICSVLLSILTTASLILISVVGFCALVVLMILYSMCLPFVVIYNCVKYKCEFGDDEHGSNQST